MIIDHILIPFYRSCLHHICCKSASCNTWNFTVNHGHICTAFVFNFCCRRSCFKPLCCGNTTCNYFHIDTPPLPDQANYMFIFQCNSVLKSGPEPVSNFTFTDTSEPVIILPLHQTQTPDSYSELPVRQHLLPGCQ